MPRRVSHRRRQRGGAWYDDAWSWLKKAHNWVKSNKIVSTVGKPLAAAFAPEALPLVNAAQMAGYGRRRKCVSCRVVRRRR
jgi:hypothetical protein